MNEKALDNLTIFAKLKNMQKRRRADEQDRIHKTRINFMDIEEDR